MEPTAEKHSEGSSSHYKGVRKRKWGKWVSEIRLPNSRDRIWLGSYDTPEKAARAFDAALFCLRGRNAKFNFPDNPPEIAGAETLTPPEIQAAAARFANEEPQTDPSPSSVSDAIVPGDGEPKTDWIFLDLLTTMGSSNNVSDFSGFSGVNDFPDEFYPPQPVTDNDNGEDNDGGAFGQQSFLWNF